MIDESMMNDTDAAEMAAAAEAVTDTLAVADVPELTVEDPMPVSVDADIPAQLRVLEAILFAASAPLDEKTIALHLARGPIGQGADVPALIAAFKEQFASRGVVLFESGGKYSLRSATDLADYLKTETTKPVKLSKAQSEVLAIVAYHQPVTRAEVEAIRGVATSKGTLDFLMEVGWVRPGHRRDTPGRPLTWITTPAFLDHFGLSSTDELPGMEELKAAGLLDSKAVTTYGVLPGSEAELTAAVEDSVEVEPDFLPSAETTAELSADTEEDAIAEDSEEEIQASEDGESADSGDEDDEIVDEDEDDFDDDDDDFDDDEDEASAEEDEAEISESAEELDEEKLTTTPEPEVA